MSTLQQIIDSTRYRLNNYEQPYVWLQEELVFYANDVINKMCEEGSVLEDSTTSSVCEISLDTDKIDYLIASSIISIRDVKIVNQELFMLDVAPASPWSVGDVIHGNTSGSDCTIIKKVSEYQYIVSYRSGSYTSSEVLTNGTETADQGAGYPSLEDYKVSPLIKTTKNEMDKYYSGWRTATHAQPYKYLLDYNTGYISLYPKPDTIYTLRLSVYRYPLVGLTTTNMSAQVPEIPAKYHNIIIDGICAQAYLKNGDNTYDAKKAAAHFALFSKAVRDIKIKNNLFKGDNTGNRPHSAFI